MQPEPRRPSPFGQPAVYSPAWPGVERLADTLADTIERWEQLDADFKDGLLGSPPFAQVLRNLMIRQHFPEFAPLTRDDALAIAAHLWLLVPADGRSTIVTRLDATGSLVAGSLGRRLWFGDFMAGQMVTVSRLDDVFRLFADKAPIALIRKAELLHGFREEPSLFIDGFMVLPLEPRPAQASSAPSARKAAPSI
ncbi:hypothetical protein [Oleomonas cavernae]|nr:hypothetical protein [Oleomonas cavernae]